MTRHEAAVFFAVFFAVLFVAMIASDNASEVGIALVASFGAGYCLARALWR